MPPCPQNHARFIHGRVHRGSLARRLRRDPHIHVATAILFHPRGHGQEHIVVQALPERRALLLANPHDAIYPSIHADFLTHCIDAWHQVVYNVGADHGHGRVMFQIRFSEHSPRINIDVPRHRYCGRHSPHHRVAERMLAIFHMAGLFEGVRSHVRAKLAPLPHRAVIVHGQVFAFHRFDIVIDVRGRR